jgi:hypothetical protein
MYSDMSIFIRALSSLKRNSVKAFASSVLPTPVGPRKKNEPIGLVLDFRPALDLLMAFEMDLTASSCAFGERNSGYLGDGK